MASINTARVERVAGALKELGLDNILLIEEKLDPQYSVMQTIAKRHGRGVAAVYGALTALISYKLTMPGEEWWSCLAEYLKSTDTPAGLDEVASGVIGFIDWCRGSIIARDAKKRRISRVVANARHILEEILANPDIVIEEPTRIVNSIAKALGVDAWRKTVVFSLKMAYYAVRRPGSLTPLEATIPLPVDIRVSCLTYTSGILNAKGYREIQVKQRPAQEAWRIVSMKSGVPPMHIDTIIWLSGRYVREYERDKARLMIASMLGKVVDRKAALRVASELTWRECR
ncbi:MAG: N-glycosylase/DNA lyase [Desulfurococcales archaeon]|nr:N-glycosylase/DNA lyase [Desulfurococcales archaeon]